MLLIGVVALPLSACTDDSSAMEGANGTSDTPAEMANDASDTSASDADGMPPIYVAQTVTLVEDGQVAQERNYRQLLEACQKAGVPITPVDKDDVKKLGRTYYQLWFEAGREAYQTDRWDFKLTDPSSCHFIVEHESDRVVTTTEATYEIDLIAHTATRGPPLWDVRPLKALSDKDVAEFQKIRKMSDETSEELGYKKLGYSKSAGQRCERWRDPHGNESCVWSEGTRWGFAAGMGFGQAGSYDPGAIVLWIRPADGTGGKLTTQRMTVGGRLFDEDVFDVPANVEVTRQGG